jgi:hypothetical protein
MGVGVKAMLKAAAVSVIVAVSNVAGVTKAVASVIGESPTMAKLLLTLQNA